MDRLREGDLEDFDAGLDGLDEEDDLALDDSEVGVEVLAGPLPGALIGDLMVLRRVSDPALELKGLELALRLLKAVAPASLLLP